MTETSPCVLVAPGPYKECLSSVEVAKAMQAGVKEILPDSSILVRPLSDGGSGFASLLVEASGGHIVKARVKNPLGEDIDSSFGILGDRKTAVIESASAAGLALVNKDRRNPIRTSTFGVGQLILKAVAEGARSIIVGCGDSATNDCGVGCAAALGARFYDKGSKLIDLPTGGDLDRITRIDLERVDPAISSSVDIVVACNLASVLCGPEGTSIIYGPQKGASPEEAAILHENVQHFVDLVYHEQGVDLGYIPGAGGAGGLAAALYAFFRARLLYSIDVVDQYVHLDDYLSPADLVLTGEGCIDDRTATGKVACGIALKAKKYGLPVVAIVGSISRDHEDIYYNGIDAVECIADRPLTAEESFEHAPELIRLATMRVVRFLSISRRAKLVHDH